MPTPYYQSKETEKLIQQNKKLLEENSVMKRQLELHEDTETMLGTRTYLYQKVIKKLQTKLEEAQSDKKEREMKDIVRNRNEKELEMRIDQEKQKKLDAMGELEEAYEETDCLRKEYKEIQRSHEKISSLQNESINFIWSCVEDVRLELGMEPKVDVENGTVTESVSGTPLGNACETAGQSLTRSISAEIGVPRDERTNWKPTREIRNLLDTSVEERGQILEMLFRKLSAFQNGHQSLMNLMEEDKDYSTLSLAAMDPSDVKTFTGLSLPEVVAAHELTKTLDCDKEMDDTTVIRVNGNVRPWGQSSKTQALTRRSPNSFLKKCDKE